MRCRSVVRWLLEQVPQAFAGIHGEGFADVAVLNHIEFSIAGENFTHDRV